MATTNYVAAVPVVKVSVGPANGNQVARFVRKGLPIPDGVPEEKLKQLEALKLIKKAPAKPAATSTKPATGDQSGSDSK